MPLAKPAQTPSYVVFDDEDEPNSVEGPAPTEEDVQMITPEETERRDLEAALRSKPDSHFKRSDARADPNDQLIPLLPYNVYDNEHLVDFAKSVLPSAQISTKEAMRERIAALQKLSPLYEAEAKKRQHQAQLIPHDGKTTKRRRLTEPAKTPPPASQAMPLAAQSDTDRPSQVQEDSYWVGPSPEGLYHYPPFFFTSKSGSALPIDGPSAEAYRQQGLQAIPPWLREAFAAELKWVTDCFRIAAIKHLREAMSHGQNETMATAASRSRRWTAIEQSAPREIGSRVFGAMAVINVPGLGSQWAPRMLRGNEASMDLSSEEYAAYMSQNRQAITALLKPIFKEERQNMDRYGQAEENFSNIWKAFAEDIEKRDMTLEEVCDVGARLRYNFFPLAGKFYRPSPWIIKFVKRWRADYAKQVEQNKELRRVSNRALNKLAKVPDPYDSSKFG